MIHDIHTHHYPHIPNSAIVQLTPNQPVIVSGYYYSVGLHPWKINDDWRTEMAKVAVMAMHRQVVMIGEAGIDKKIGDAPKELQMEVLREHVRLSEMLCKPLIVHCVKAVDELLAIRKEMKVTLPWVVHGFRGGKEQYEQLKRAGIYTSISLFHDRELVQSMALTDILLETDDSQYCDIDDVYELIANELSMDKEELLCQVWRNIRYLLGWDLKQGANPPF